MKQIYFSCIFLTLTCLLSAEEQLFKTFLPDKENQIIDRKVELIARYIEERDIPPINLPLAESNEEFEENLIGAFKEAARSVGDDPEKILREFIENRWTQPAQLPNSDVLVRTRRASFKESVGNVKDIQIFIISRGYAWQKGKTLVEDSKGGGLSVENLITNVLMPVPRIAEMLKNQDALVAIGTASAEIGDEGQSGEIERGLKRASELAKALAHSPSIKCPIFTSNWGRYSQGDRDQSWQREIVILGLARDKETSKIDLEETDLRGLMTAFSIIQEGQNLNPSNYSGKNNDPQRFVDGP